MYDYSFYNVTCLHVLSKLIVRKNKNVNFQITVKLHLKTTTKTNHIIR